jgi:hypothetical protein
MVVQNARMLAGLVLMLAIVAAQPASAHTMATSFAVQKATNTAIVTINHKRSHTNSYARYDRWNEPRAVYVDAPFTTVKTHHRYRTAVDAPFTSVRVDRGRGVWVRAPFVNLYVPR